MHLLKIKLRGLFVKNDKVREPKLDFFHIYIYIDPSNCILKIISHMVIKIFMILLLIGLEKYLSAKHDYK